MTDLKFCFPEDVPSQFASFDGKIPQMDVGKTGKIGFLKLTLESDLPVSYTHLRAHET